MELSWNSHAASAFLIGMTSDKLNKTGPSRRGFLASVGLGAASSALPDPGPAGTTPLSPAQPAILLSDAELRGLSYHVGPDLIDRIAPATRLFLKRDAENGHDPQAVSIHLATGERIGYVPREENRAMAALLDAGHQVLGELTELDRIEFETRLSGDGKPFAGRVILEELGLDTDGVRRVRMAELRPRFKAWLATGLAPDGPAPDPLVVPGWPGWKKLVPEFEPTSLMGQALVQHAQEIAAGVELTVESRETDYESRFWLRLPGGAHIGSLVGAEADALIRAIEAGLDTKVVITRVRRHNDAIGGFGSPWLELRCKGDVPPLPTAEQREFRRKEREAARDAAFQRDMQQFFAKAAENDARHAAITSAIKAVRESAAQADAAQEDAAITRSLQRDALDDDPMDRLAESLLSPDTLKRLSALAGFGMLSSDPGSHPDWPHLLLARDGDGVEVLIVVHDADTEPLMLDSVFAFFAERNSETARAIWLRPDFGLADLETIDWLNRRVGRSAFLAIEICRTDEGDHLSFSVLTLHTAPERGSPA